MAPILHPFGISFVCHRILLVSNKKVKGKSKEQEDRKNYTQGVEVSGHVIYYSGLIYHRI